MTAASTAPGVPDSVLAAYYALLTAAAAYDAHRRLGDDDSASVIAVDDAWVRFGQAATRAGLRISDALANCRPGGSS